MSSREFKLREVTTAFMSWLYRKPDSLTSERARLEHEVIKQAKAMRLAGKVVSYEFDRAVDALIAFEAEQNK